MVKKANVLVSFDLLFQRFFWIKMLLFLFMTTGLEKPYKNGKDVKDFSTADQKPMKKIYSLSAFLQCPVSADPKCFSQAKHFKSSEGKKCIKHQDSKNGIKTRHKQRAVKFEMVWKLFFWGGGSVGGKI